MILPSKHISQEKALLTIGANILKHLDQQRTISSLWEATTKYYKNDQSTRPQISYDWFVLALDLLYAIGAIELHNGLLYRSSSL